MMMKTYTMLTKPGIILGNVITTVAGFALASKGHFDYWLFLVTLIGLSFLIASAGVFNNYIDREMDSKMVRTKNRALVKGMISNQSALIFGALLGLVGVIFLALYTNILTLLIALGGFFVYLVLYALLKIRSFYGTIIGSIAGGVPPLVGYCAVSNDFDTGAFLLFMILVLWQMPHFFAIAVYHFDDYQAASIPVLPVVKGMHKTKIHMVFYIIGFTLTALMLTILGYTGGLYFMSVILLGLMWLGLCINGFNIKNDARWARQMFVLSLVVIMGLCLTMTVDVANLKIGDTDDTMKITAAQKELRD